MKEKRLKVLHVISGGDTGGAKTCVITLLKSQQEIMDVQLVCFMEAEFTEEAKENGINTIIYKQKNRFDLSVLNNIKELIETNKYDLINCHGARANFIISNMKKDSKIPVITTIHSDFNHDFDNNIYKKLVFTTLNKASLKSMDAYVVVAKQFKENMIEKGYKNEDIFIGYNGLAPIKTNINVDKERFLSKISVDYDENYFYVGLAIRLHPIKGIDVVLKAAKILKSVQPNIKILVAGGGEEKYRKEYEKYIEENDLSDTIYLIGFVDNIYEFYKCIDINAIASHSEGMSYALLEGGRFVKPTVASRVGGNVDIVIDGETGLLFEDNDSQGFVDKILEIYNNSEYGNELALGLKDRVENLFSDVAMAKNYLSIYNEVLKKSITKIVVSGYYGYSNSGDDAILKCICQGINGLEGNNDVTILSYKPEKTMEEYEAHAVNKFSLIEIVKAISDCDVFLMGGGTLLQDETSNRSLYYYLFLLWYAKLRKKKVMLYANGIGPVQYRFNRRMTKLIVNSLDLITLRENMSYKELEKLNITKPEIHVTADPVFTLKTLEEIDVDWLLQKEGVDTSKKNTVVLFRKWENQKNYIPKIANICDEIYDTYGFNIVLVPMKHPADVNTCQAISDAMNRPSYILKKKYDVMTLIEIIGQSEIVLSMRLHALLYAALKGIPMVGFSYSLKIKYYMKELNMPCIDDVRDFEVEDVWEIISKIMSDYDKYKENLIIQNDKLKKEAICNNNYLEELIK